MSRMDGAPRTGKTFADRVRLRTLPGGGRLAVLPNPHAPTVTVVGMLQAGPAVATDGRLAVPGLTASMLRRGVEGKNRLELARELEDHGLQLDVGASSAAPASVSFSLQGLAEELPRMVDLLADVLRRPTFERDELDKVRQQILGVLRHENDDTSMRAFAEFSRQIFPPGHPHRRRTIAEREREVQGITRDDLRVFHEEVYGGATLVAAVVGQVEVDEVDDLFAKAFQGWRPGRTGLPKWPQATPQSPRETTILIPDRPNLDVYLGHPGRLLSGDDDLAAATLANSCLGQSTLTSRLGVAVRDRAGLTYGINSYFMGKLQIPGPWVVNLSVSAADLERAVALCREVIEDYVAEGPRAEELEDERRAWSGAYTVGLATNVGVARELVRVLLEREPISQMDRFPAELMACSKEQVLQAIRRHIHPEQLVMVAAGTVGGEQPTPSR